MTADLRSGVCGSVESNRSWQLAREAMLFFLRYAEIAEQNKEPRWAAKVLIARRPEK